MKKYSHYDYPFYCRNNNMPYLTKRQMAIVHNVLQIKDVEKRCEQFKHKGFEIKRCFVPSYNGICGLTYMSRLNEIRIIIGRPKCHSPKEVYAIIIK